METVSHIYRHENSVTYLQTCISYTLDSIMKSVFIKRRKAYWVDMTHYISYCCCCKVTYSTLPGLNVVLNWLNHTFKSEYKSTIRILNSPGID